MHDQAQDETIYEVTIYLKSGTPFTIDCTKFTLHYHKGTDELASVKWTNPDAFDRYTILRHIEVGDISAIVEREKQ